MGRHGPKFVTYPMVHRLKTYRRLDDTLGSNYFNYFIYVKRVPVFTIIYVPIVVLVVQND